MSRFIPRRRYVTYRGELADLVRAPFAADGNAVTAFEAALARYHGIAHAHCVNSGRVALLILLDALGLRPGDEILVPAYTLRALVRLLAEHGYVPVPVDIDPRTFNLDPERIRSCLGPASRAILATHLFGRPCAIRAIRDIAREHGLLLIEDCAQALGSEVGKDKVGGFGDGAILSFDLLKSINTFGGGAILTPHAEVSARVAERIATLEKPGGMLTRRILAGLAEHAILTTPLARLAAHALAHPRGGAMVARRYRAMQDALRPSGARYTDLQARIGLRLLDSLDARVAARRAQARLLATALGEDTNATLARGDNSYFFVREAVGDPETLRADLLRAGIDAGIGAEVADYCGKLGGKPGGNPGGDLGRAGHCPAAEAAHRRAIQLPLHEGVTDADLCYIAARCAGRLLQPTNKPMRPDPGRTAP